MTSEILSTATFEQYLTMPDAIEAIRRVLTHEHDGAARNIPKTMTTWSPSSSAHALGALDEVDGLVAFKVWINTPDGAAAILNLFDVATGSHKISMDAGALGMYRTAAIAGLATDIMSERTADELAILGTGRQAFHQVAAVASVRSLRRVRVWSPNEEHRSGFARRIQETLGISADAAPTVESALRGAPLVTTITRSSEPLVTIGMLAPGAHLNAMGAILPSAAEIDSSVLEAAATIAVDSLENAQMSSRELGQFVGDDWSRIVRLSDLVTRPANDLHDGRLTVFKAMGMGLSDLALAAMVMKKLGH